MDDNLQALIKEDSRYCTLLRSIAAEPYIEHQTLVERSGIPVQELEQLLEMLTGKMVVLELASQADSSVESRVPKKVYLLNPEREREICELI